jgi:RNA polymerase sigma-70 factor (ECF subfamily)
MEELDEDTVRAAARGDRQGFRTFYAHYAPAVWRLALRTVGGDEHLAGQVTQDVFVRAHGSLRRFSFRSAVSTWLYRIAWNRCMSALSERRRWWSKVVPLDDLPGADAAAGFEERDLIRTILGGLNAQDRFLLTAREIDGVPFEELAEITGIASGALRTRLSRIKDGIRKGATES